MKRSRIVACALVAYNSIEKMTDLIKKVKFFAFCAMSVIVISMGVFIFAFNDHKRVDVKSVDNDLFLLSPAVSANLGKHFIINFSPLRQKLESIQKRYPQKTYIYFLYINNGVWIGFNEREEFTAASTFKVPLAMSVYDLIEEGKIRFTDRYSIEELDLNSDFGKLYQTGLNMEFTVEDLLKIMLEQSDNTAMNAIHTVMSRLGIENPLGKVYNELGWQFLTPPEIDAQPDYSRINLRTLANMFLALYNSTFLDKAADSQKILEYLSNTPFKDKIVAGVPENIVVSHKIGISGGDKTFSDCGIVYAPNRHYILCLGSNGNDEASASDFMKEISAEVYKYVINN